jgi:hypothetical protein
MPQKLIEIKGGSPEKRRLLKPTEPMQGGLERGASFKVHDNCLGQQLAVSPCLAICGSFPLPECLLDCRHVSRRWANACEKGRD